MDKAGIRSKSRNTIRTDLSLLLECLKFQMKSPDLQKQALLTIHSICEKREDNVDLLREMGGVVFVYNLSKSGIVHADVKETALFTLGTLAEANVYCKNSLCKKETFADVAGCLMKDDIPLTQKRVSVYLLSVLVANNKSGQTLAQTTGCLDILLDLFRTTFPISTDATLRAVNATQTHQLWTSVSSALCGCINNPQNEEGQRICVAAFPIIKIWLQQIALPCTEIFQPICSFIAMIVANNSCVQEGFSASGGLETLTLALVRLVSAADTSLLSCQLSVTITKTLSACITDNCALASGLAQYDIVLHLVSLLTSPNLDPEDRLSVLLTLAQCTEAAEEHQFQLVKCGGLPLIITLLTEDSSEEVRKVATFILQTCKQATMCLGVPGLIVNDVEGDNEEPITKMEGFRSSARVLLHKIELLEKRQMKEAQGDTNPSTLDEGLGQPALSLLPSESVPTAYRQNRPLKHAEGRGHNNITLQNIRSLFTKEIDSELRNMNSTFNSREEKAKTRGDLPCSVCRGTGVLVSAHAWPQEGSRVPHTEVSPLFKLPVPVKHSLSKEIKCTKDLQNNEMSEVETVSLKKNTFSHIRCAGCVLSFEEVTSRTFASLQSSCCQSCDMHKALQEATERFRRENADSTVELTNSDEVSPAEPQRSHKNDNAGRRYSSLPENPWKYIAPCLTPIKRMHLPGERRVGEEKNGPRILDHEPKTSTNHCSARRTRKDFSREEVCYLLNGVKTFGFSWNSILWSYPFQSGRTNVDLAKKYRRLMATGKK